MKDIVVLSGANGGIGKAIALSLLDKYEVYGFDLASKPTIDDPSYHYIQADVTKKEDIAKIKNEIGNAHIHAVVAAAGIFYMESIIDGDENNLRKIIEVNFFGTYNLIRECFPLLNKNSRIIILTSEVARYSPQPFMGYYTLSKHLVDCYADVLRRECNYLNIKVSKVQSGSISTGLLSKVNGQYDELLGQRKEFIPPLTKFRGLMLNEIKKNRNPIIMGRLIRKIIDARKPKARYRIKNSKALRLLNTMPEACQDAIYTKFIK